MTFSPCLVIFSTKTQKVLTDMLMTKQTSEAPVVAHVALLLAVGRVVVEKFAERGVPTFDLLTKVTKADFNQPEFLGLLF